jgi:uncharacterized Tic20 family protein
MSPWRTAAVAHASAVAVAIGGTILAGGLEIWVGMTAWLGPLAILLARPEAFVRRHALAALRYNASIALYLGAIVLALRLTAGSPYTVQFVPFLLFLNLLIAFNWLLFCAIAVNRAATGQEFTYPMTLRRPRRRASLTLGRSH